ncbi:MAG: ectonucleotide pyrophosphatase/phosphodiesterase [Melioribacter sp.]|nr:ectonucleotide pyrophosphatase/phosphodiesterase [Melioribacter sp.]
MKKNFNIIVLILCIIPYLTYSQKPYVLLISFDGFRWDYLNRGITPNLNKICEEGVHALSLKPTFPSRTFPNHISLITGLYTENHGIIGNHFADPYHSLIYKLSDTISVRDGRWYLGEAFWETAERNGIKTASYFWPGSEIKIPYRRPSYFKYYNHNTSYKEKVETIISWLKLPPYNRPHFITLYFHEVDTYGHDFGPNSPEVNKAIQYLDSITGNIFNELAKINMKDSVNVIIVSDHGMTTTSNEKAIDIENFIKNYNCRIVYDGPIAQIEPAPQNRKEVFDILKKNENHFKVYLKEEIPDYYHFKAHPFISSIIAIADLGWSFVTGSKKNFTAKGDHGYDNNQLDMHGIFIAKGPLFKKNYKTGTLWNIDLYPLLCKIFNISPRSNIDGKLERIEFILNEK